MQTCLWNKSLSNKGSEKTNKLKGKFTIEIHWGLSQKKYMTVGNLLKAEDFLYSLKKSSRLLNEC